MKWNKRLAGAWIALLAALADRLTKALVTGAAAGRRTLVPGLLALTPVRNEGMAFSMLSGQGLILTLLTAVLIVGLIGWLLLRPGQAKLFRAGLWLIVGGGLGNLYDRLVQGSVTDFLEMKFVRFAVFNIADACICVGAALAVLSTVLEEFGKKRA